jgi:hypothetical protein
VKSRLLPKRRALRSRGPSKTDRIRRLLALGLPKHGDEDEEKAALAIVARFLAWTATRPCAASGWRPGELHEYQGQEWIIGVEAAHVVETRGHFGGDLGCVVPLCTLLHREQHRDPTFWTRRHLDPLILARAHAVRFFREDPAAADWIIAHAQDGDAVALATAGLEER